MMTLRSRSKSSKPLPQSSSPSIALLPQLLPFSDSGLQVPRSFSPPPATEGMTALSPWSKGLRGTPQEAARRWTRRQEEARHHLVIWPIVAVLLVFTMSVPILPCLIACLADTLPATASPSSYKWSSTPSSKEKCILTSLAL